MLYDLEQLDRSDPSYEIQRSIFCGYAEIGRLVLDINAQKDVGIYLEQIKICWSRKDEEGARKWSNLIRAQVERSSRIQREVSIAALNLKQAAERMVEAANNALKKPEPVENGEPTG